MIFLVDQEHERALEEWRSAERLTGERWADFLAAVPADQQLAAAA